MATSSKFRLVATRNGTPFLEQNDEWVNCGSGVLDKVSALEKMGRDLVRRSEFLREAWEEGRRNASSNNAGDS